MRWRVTLFSCVPNCVATLLCPRFLSTQPGSGPGWWTFGPYLTPTPGQMQFWRLGACQISAFWFLSHSRNVTHFHSLNNWMPYSEGEMGTLKWNSSAQLCESCFGTRADSWVVSRKQRSALCSTLHYALRALRPALCSLQRSPYCAAQSFLLERDFRFFSLRTSYNVLWSYSCLIPLPKSSQVKIHPYFPPYPTSLFFLCL